MASFSDQSDDELQQSSAKFEPGELNKNYSDSRPNEKDGGTQELLTSDSKASTTELGWQSKWLRDDPLAQGVKMILWWRINVFCKRVFTLTNALVLFVALVILYHLIYYKVSFKAVPLPQNEANTEEFQLFEPLGAREGPPLVELSPPTKIRFPSGHPYEAEEWLVSYVSARPVSNKELLRMFFEPRAVVCQENDLPAENVSTLEGERYCNRLEAVWRRRFYRSFDAQYGDSAIFADYRLIPVPADLVAKLFGHIGDELKTQESIGKADSFRDPIVERLDRGQREYLWIGLAKVESEQPKNR